MKDKVGNYAIGISAIASVEKQIAAALAATASEVSRAECFDPDQRSEIYVILERLKADSKAHSDLVGRWVNDWTGKVADV